MKKMTKFLALVLAGLLSVSVLLACSDESSSEDDEDEKEENTEFAEYEDLTPEEVWDALDTAEQVQITLSRFNGTQSTILKDGDNAKFDPNGAVIYYDYQNGKEYIPNEDGSHSAQYLLYSWTELLDQEVKNNFFKSQGLAFFLEDDWYEDSGSLYSATEDTLSGIEMDCESISAYMKDKGTTYTFVCEMVVNGEEQTAKCKIEFKEVSVKLPSSNSSDTPANTTTNPPVTNPPVTNPPVTNPPVTNPPVSPETEEPSVEIPAGVKTPYALYTDLLNANNATISLKFTDNGITYNYSFEKDGNVFLSEQRYSGTTSTVYHDNDAERRYFQDNGQWYYQSDTMNWSALLSEISNIMKGTFHATDSYYTYNAAMNQIVMKDTYLEALDLRNVTLKQSGESYILSIVYPDFSTSTLNVKFSIFADLKLPASAQPAPSDLPETTPGGTDYAGMKPSELYNAIVNAEDITITVTGSTTDTTYIKDGDLIYIEVSGTSVYIDFSTGLGYAQQGGQWVSGNSAYANWNAVMSAMQLSPSTYIFVDNYYNSFSSSDSELTIQSSLLIGSELTSSMLLREGNTYTLVESYKNGVTLYTSFCFDPTTVELPA